MHGVLVFISLLKVVTILAVVDLGSECSWAETSFDQSVAL